MKPSFIRWQHQSTARIAECQIDRFTEYELLTFAYRVMMVDWMARTH